jgi:hypothetical protein
LTTETAKYDAARVPDREIKFTNTRNESKTATRNIVKPVELLETRVEVVVHTNGITKTAIPITAEFRFPESLSVETREIRTKMRTRPTSQTNTPTWELKDILAISPNIRRKPLERFIVFREIEMSDRASTLKHIVRSQSLSRD